MDSEVRRTFPKKVSKKPGKPGGKGKSLAQERRDEKAKRQKESRMKKNQETYESLNGPVARILEGPDDVNIQKKPTGKPDKNKNPGKKKKRQEKKAKLLNQPLAQIFEAHESSPDVDEIREIPQVNMAKKKKQLPPKVFKSDSDDDEDKEPEKMTVEEVVQVDDEPMEDEEVETEGEEDDDQEEEEDEAAEFRKKVANMPLVDVRELREKLGLKLFEKLYFAKPENKHQPINEKHQKKDRASHDMEGKKGQHRPREISSRKPVSSFRDIFKNESLGRKKWDPRFDERAGTLKEHCFDDNYQFLNEMKQQEKEVLRHELYQAVENGEEETASRITNAIRKLEEQERVKKEKDLKKAAMSEIRQENIDRMMQGQQPRFLPKAQVRRKIMEKKFEQLKTEKRLDKYLEKKAKKQSQKEKKKKGLVQHSFDAKYGYN